uniref:Peptidase S1 domain-containing protein n=1 Tax=Stomoxys calcitrans TaxID=35570 RepID=A0A1I8P9N3_STOCA
MQLLQTKNNRDSHVEIRKASSIKGTNTATGILRMPTMAMASICWTLMAGIMLASYIPLSQAAFDGDPCETKGMTGVCKAWLDCPVIKTLIERGEYSNREVVSCGFAVRDELICCPIIRSETKIDNSTDKPKVETTTLAMEETTKEFWLDVLEKLNATTTTQKPDFWLDLLSTTTPTTTTSTTTTIKPLVIGDKRLNESSEFFDFSQLLNQNKKNEDKKAKNPAVPRESNTRMDEPSDGATDAWRVPNNQPVFVPQTNDRGQMNGQVNWGQGQPNGGRGNNFFNEPVRNNGIQGNTGRGQASFWPNQRESNGRGTPNQGNIWPNQQQQNNGLATPNQGNMGGGPMNIWPNQQGNQFQGNMGRGQTNMWQQLPTNGRGNRGNGGRGPNNVWSLNSHNGRQGNRAQGNIGLGQNNNWNLNPENQRPSNSPPGFPNGNIFPQEESPVNWNVAQQPQGSVNIPQQQTSPPSSTPSSSVPNLSEEERVNKLINSIFQTSDSLKPNDEMIIYTVPTEQNSNPHALWPNTDQIEIINPNGMESIPALPMQMAPTMPLLESHMDVNDLEASPSTTNVIVQEYQIEDAAASPSSFNPIQTVYENLVNAGMDIVKAKADKVQHLWQMHQQPSVQGQSQTPVQQTQFGPQQGQIGRQPSQVQFQQPQSQLGRQWSVPTQQLGNQPEPGRQPLLVQQPPQSPQIQQASAQQFGRQPIPIQQPARNPPLNRQPSLQEQQLPENSQLTRQPSTHIQFPQQNPPARPIQSGQNSVIFPAQQSSPVQNPNPASSSTTFGQNPPTSGQFPNIQSPPANILDPFKPFEFRPPPEDELGDYDNDNSLSPTTTVKPIQPNERPAVKACRRIEKGLTAGISNHILGGIPTELGEFPHMVGIGYGRIGDDGRGPYDIRCGGTLIDARFVLTAAHCVAARDSIPSIVRMGVVNFTDPNEMANAVEIRIKETFIHNDYSQRRTYNDIAVLELEQPAPFSSYIYPVCLYTDEADPNPNVRLWVTGWGTVNTKTRTFSNILLKAPLHVTPLEKCNASFVDYGLTRQIDQGIIKTQLCAEDDQQLKDACQGDSGGPLNLVVDESYYNYRVVGVVSSGFGCASSTPGLYTRVAAFLDFVEQVVWPNGGD